jgi:dUTP pyrophosphatase
MRIKPIHPNFIMPTKGSDQAGAYDLYMPEDGIVSYGTARIKLGFAAEVPTNHVALLLPRSSTGANHGLELNNTCGVIDADYRGEWMAVLRTKSGNFLQWKAGDRLLQFLVVPVARIQLELADALDDTSRGIGGFGSSGQ